MNSVVYSALMLAAGVLGPAPAEAGVGGAFAWKPFIDPIDLHGAVWLGGWTLLVPLALGIAIIYKAVRAPDVQPDPETGQPAHSWWSVYWRQVLVLTVQIVVSMIALAAAMFLFVEVYVKWIAEKAA